MSRDEIILKALVEYEENHWQSEGEEWQKTVNDLINKYQEKTGDTEITAEREMTMLLDRATMFYNFKEDSDLESVYVDVLDLVDSVDFNYGQFIEGWTLQYDESHKPFVTIQGEIYGNGNKVAKPITAELLRSWLESTCDYLCGLLGTEKE